MISMIEFAEMILSEKDEQESVKSRGTIVSLSGAGEISLCRSCFENMVDLEPPSQGNLTTFLGKQAGAATL